MADANRIFKPKAPYRGETRDHIHLEKDLHLDLQRVTRATMALSDGVDDAQAAADAAAAAAAEAKGQTGGTGKTNSSVAFAPSAGVWTDLPDSGGSGTLEKVVTTKGGNVTAQGFCTWERASNDEVCDIRIAMDGTGGANEASCSIKNAGTKLSAAVTQEFSPTAGAHSFTVQGATAAGHSVNVYGAGIAVTELKN